MDRPVSSAVSKTVGVRIVRLRLISQWIKSSHRGPTTSVHASVSIVSPLEVATQESEPRECSNKTRFCTVRSAVRGSKLDFCGGIFLGLDQCENEQRSGYDQYRFHKSISRFGVRPAEMTPVSAKRMMYPRLQTRPDIAWTRFFFGVDVPDDTSLAFHIKLS